MRRLLCLLLRHRFEPCDFEPCEPRYDVEPMLGKDMVCDEVCGRCVLPAWRLT